MKFTHPKDAKPGHKWQLRNGTPVDEVIAFSNGRVAAFCQDYTISRDGNGKVLGICDTQSDLVDAPVTHTGWLNIYKGGSQDFIKPTREEADMKAKNVEEFLLIKRVACLQITYTEGEGL